MLHNTDSDFLNLSGDKLGYSSSTVVCVEVNVVDFDVVEVRHSREKCAGVVVDTWLTLGASGAPCVAVSQDGEYVVRYSVCYDG